ncbi:MAG: hypothetical protein BGO89_13630 [Candidatus Kapaibacterium thiocyanatum]|uniref:tRNA_anti-like n=1 Tax=Candidatus Kapaibacterium thiocyanatum TaxID=1895771 RepID=A0A1M3KV70_9BACT|nr:MAG: hypothetical protein BGO89_13630 ['Candidatus Kapabacteria' thiocyanatum]
MLVSEGTKKPIYKTLWFWVGIIVVVGIIGSQAGKKDAGASGVQSTTESTASTGTAPEKPKETPPMAVTAIEYYESYDGNEVTADAKFKGKRIAITGTVKGVEKTFGSIYAELEGNELYGHVQCKLQTEADAAKLTKGQSTTLIGVADGKMMGSPRVTDCVVK